MSETIIHLATLSPAIGLSLATCIAAWRGSPYTVTLAIVAAVVTVSVRAAAP